MMSEIKQLKTTFVGVVLLLVEKTTTPHHTTITTPGRTQLFTNFK
jgi:hypothetical protein